MKRLFLLLMTTGLAAARPSECLVARFRTDPPDALVFQQVSGPERQGRFLGNCQRPIRLDTAGSQVWLVFRAPGYRDQVVAVAPGYFRQAAEWPPAGVLRLQPDSVLAWLKRLAPGLGFVAAASALVWTWKRRTRPRLLLGGYELLEGVGYGGSGQVYRARSPLEPGKWVAVKIFNPGHNPQPQPSGHPAFVQIFHQGQSEGIDYQVMEWLSGGCLSDRLRGGPIALELARSWLHRLSEALCTAHEQGFFHGDLKPDNLLFSASDDLKVIDFSGEVAGAGTPAYASPEQILGGQVGPLCDQYALALLCWELLEGRRPESFHRVLQPLKPPARTTPELSAVLERMSQPDPCLRYPSLAEARGELLSWLCAL